MRGEAVSQHLKGKPIHSPGPGACCTAAGQAATLVRRAGIRHRRDRCGRRGGPATAGGVGSPWCRARPRAAVL